MQIFTFEEVQQRVEEFFQQDNTKILRSLTSLEEFTGMRYTVEEIAKRMKNKSYIPRLKNQILDSARQQLTPPGPQQMKYMSFKIFPKKERVPHLMRILDQQKQKDTSSLIPILNKEKSEKSPEENSLKRFFFLVFLLLFLFLLISTLLLFNHSPETETISLEKKNMSS